MSKTILVVEDEVVIAMDLQATLLDLGYNVPEIVTSGIEAVQRALALQPDLVLMDIHLQDAVDGIEAAAQIIAALDIPVVYLTAYADEVTVERASHTQPFGYILKPFEARELKANLEIALYKHALEREFKESQQWFFSVLTSISDGVIATDEHGLIKFMNPIAEALTGWTQAEAIGQSAEQVCRFIHTVSRTRIENPLLKAIRGQTSVHLPDNTLLLAKDGRETPVADGASPIRKQTGDAQGAVMVFRDIAEQYRMQMQLEHNALHDSLTQLPNRTLFFDRLQQAVERARRNPAFGFAVMLLDLDRFKVINDTWGHLLGDQLLIDLAPRLEQVTRSTDTVARLGGDEFVILMEDVTDPAIASRTAQRLIQVVSQPVVIEGHEMLINVSIGVVLNSIPYENATDLLRDADIAMYRAKSRGGGCFEMYDSAMHTQARRLMQLEHGLRQAIARAELRLEYQPVVDLVTGQLVSVEALVRWEKPQEGRVTPGQFIPLAEEVGLIADIDQWVMQTACCQLKHWQLEAPIAVSDRPLSLTMGVNVSSKRLCQQNFLASVSDVLKTTQLKGEQLKFEITESVLIENVQRVSDIFQQLKDWGIQICLDDFGTGYSSLSYLHRLPIDIVKIDRSFIREIDTDSEKFEIVRAMMNLCQSLGKPVIAEGIETVAQRDILRELGCEYGQGYLFAYPTEALYIYPLLGTRLPRPEASE